MQRANILIRVRPRARHDEIGPIRNGAVVVRVAAPPLDGRANAAVTQLVAARLGVRPAAVKIVRGQRARDKVVAVEGVDQAEAEQALGL